MEEEKEDKESNAEDKLESNETEAEDSPKEISLEDKVKEIVIFKTNEQLDQFSNIYFNKIKKDLTIHEL